MFHRIALSLIAACVSDKAGEPMFEESGDEQSVLGSGPESPATDHAGDDEEVAADITRPSIPVGPGAAGPDADESPPAFLDDRIIAADLWGAELAILSAGMGFDGVIGLPNTDIETVRAAGGSYYLTTRAGQQRPGSTPSTEARPTTPLTSDGGCSPGPCWVQHISCSP